MGFFQKIGQFFVDCTPGEIVILAAFVLIPLLSIILLIVSAVRHAKNKRVATSEAEQDAPVAPTVPSAYSLENAQATPMPIWVAPAQASVPSPTLSAASYDPQPVKVSERVVERVKVKVNVAKLNKADKSLLAATGIFCLGLGVMIARAMSGEK